MRILENLHKMWMDLAPLATVVFHTQEFENRPAGANHSRFPGGMELEIPSTTRCAS